MKHLIDRFECSADSCGHSILLNRDHLDTVQAIDLACRRVETPLQQLEHQLHPWISYAILPLFALANTGIFFQGLDWQRALIHPVAVGIFVGLFIGKPLGIGLFTFLTIRIFKIQLTDGVTARHLIGACCLGGIGFTMSLFITGLTFTDPGRLDLAKLAIVLASVVSGLLGYMVLRTTPSSVQQLK